MKSRKKVLIAILCSILIAGIPFGSMAADKTPIPPSKLEITSGTIPPPAPVTPPGNDGLLSGMTPGSYKIPSGWSLVRVQDFEGTQPADESWTAWGTAVTTTRPHLGSKSIGGNYAGDQSYVGWKLYEGSVGSFNEIYLSFYEYVESQALFNDEFFLAQFAVQSPVFQEVVVDWFWAVDENGKNVFNGTRADLYLTVQGNRDGRQVSRTDRVPKGQWVQWEMYYRPNTSGNSDGFFRVYKNGSLYISADNRNLNGTVNMTNCSVLVGGPYTKLVWMIDSPTCTVCSTAPGQGTDYCTVAKGWSGQSFSNPRCAPRDPPLPSFKRYFDDIILMKK